MKGFKETEMSIIKLKVKGVNLKQVGMVFPKNVITKYAITDDTY